MAFDTKNAGKRIRLISTDDPHTRLKKGDEGTVIWEREDGLGDYSIAVNWDSGSTLSLFHGEDSFVILD